MDAERGAVQERQPVQGRHGVRGRVEERRGGRGIARILSRKEGIRLFRSMSVPGTT